MKTRQLATHMYNHLATGTGTHPSTTTAVSVESRTGWMMELEQLRAQLRPHELRNDAQR